MQIPAVTNGKQQAALQPQLVKPSHPEGAKKRVGNKPLSPEGSSSLIGGEASKGSTPESASSLNPAQLLR